MRILLVTTFTILGTFTAQEAKALETKYNMTEINDKLELVTERQLHILDDANAFARLRRDPDFTFIENKCKTDWSAIIDNFEAIEGGEVSKKMVVSALQILDGKDYMKALEKVLIRFEAGTIQKSVMLEMFQPTGRMQAFIADNYDHPRAIAILNRIKAKASDDADLVAKIDAILNGETKLALDKYRDAHTDTSEGNIPKIMLAE